MKNMFFSALLLAGLVSLSTEGRGERIGLGTPGDTNPSPSTVGSTTVFVVIKPVDLFHEGNLYDRYCAYFERRLERSAMNHIIPVRFGFGEYSPTTSGYTGERMLMRSFRNAGRELFFQGTPIGWYLRDHTGFVYDLLEGTFGSPDEQDIQPLNPIDQPATRLWMFSELFRERTRYGFRLGSSPSVFFSTRASRHGQELFSVDARYYFTDHYRLLNAHRFSLLTSFPLVKPWRLDVGAEYMVNRAQSAGSDGCTGIIRVARPIGEPGKYGSLFFSVNFPKVFGQRPDMFAGLACEW